MAVKRVRTTETIVYAAVWLTVAVIYLIGAMRVRAGASGPLVDMEMIAAMLHTILPLFALFLVNNNILIPRLLLANKPKEYFAVTAVAIVILWTYQYFDFMHFVESIPPDRRPRPHPAPRPLLPMPVVLDFTYALLVVGGNMAVALMFQRFDDRLEKESLMKSNAENQLAYLKYQINPHFYMNMLNNIHGMIDIDPEKAQKMLIDMSHLMRYMLYESSREVISLTDEIAFLDKYVSLMRLRYPEDKVSVEASFPPPSVTDRIALPPLLFLVFIENAFKHGVSYRQPSWISVSIAVSGHTLRFSCVNSIHMSLSPASGESHGIGLANIRKRLQLLYGDEAQLDITDSQSSYIVNLSLPVCDSKP